MTQPTSLPQHAVAPDDVRAQDHLPLGPAAHGRHRLPYGYQPPTFGAPAAYPAVPQTYTTQQYSTPHRHGAPPVGHRGLIAGLAIAAVAAAVTLSVVGAFMIGSGGSPDTVARPAPAAAATIDPQGSRGPVTSMDIRALRAAMQTFVDAVNSRDVPRMQASVCSAVRPKVTSPLDLPGNLVLEDMQNVTITGGSAESLVVTHLEAGTQRSNSKPNDENFVRENGSWFICPGTEPDAVT